VAIVVVGLAMVAYHLVSSQYVLVSGIEHRNLHLGFALLLVFLAAIKEGGPITGIVAAILAVLSVAAVVYVAVDYDALELRAAFNTVLDLVVGVVLIVVVVEGTRRAFGLILPLVALVALAYYFFGYLLPEPFTTARLSFAKIIPNLSIGLTGIYGVALGVSASYIFLFVVLGTILQVSGATGFFNEVGKLVGRRFRAGPAMSSVITSALVGSTTGSIGANIITTGSFTIPLMKRVGYRPEQAAAIEAAASNGGQIMPPVMGAAAFAMAAMTGTTYLTIMVAALVPALIYFALAGVYVQVQAAKMGIAYQVERPDIKEMLWRAPGFIIPLGLIVYLLMQGRPLPYCGFWAIVATVVLSLFRKATRASWTTWFKGFARGAVTGAQIGVACACLGLLLDTLTGTGLGLKLPGLVERWSGGHLLLALAMTALGSIILGMGVSTIGVYILVAVVTAPILIKMHMSVLQAHFFVFFFACFSMVTPPVGMGSIIASKVAGARYIPTAMEAVKVSLAGFVLPFLFIYNPELILQATGAPWWDVGYRILNCLVLMLALQVVLVGYFLAPLSLAERGGLLLAAGLIFAGFAVPLHWLFIPGLMGFAVVCLTQGAKFRARPRVPDGPAVIEEGAS
jgi:TRAP transporter 4TM/12TM fusion protein